MFDNRYIYPLVSQKWILNSGIIMLRRVWRYQRDNQNLEIEEEQTTQWPKDRRTDNTVAKRQKNRQHSGQKKKNKHQPTDHTHKAKDPQTPTYRSYT
jgi:hypothetical protein